MSALKNLRVALIAGEDSGDMLGGALMRSLKELSGGRITFYGIGGPCMREEGLESLFPMPSVAGFGDIVRSLLGLLKIVRRTADYLVRVNPHVLVIIDSPELSHRIARRVVRRMDVAVVNYAPPSVWAWRPGRAKVMRTYVRRALSVFPFEARAYVALGGPECVYVGHPITQQIWRDEACGRAFRERHGISSDAPFLLVLPGSREKEIARLSGPFNDTVSLLSAQMPQLRLCVLSAPGRLSQIKKEWKETLVIEGEEEKVGAFCAADVALAASGTVILELGLAGVPMISAYKLDFLMYLILRWALRLDTFNLVNLVLREKVVPEIYMGEVRGDVLAKMLRPLFKGPQREEMLRRLDTFRCVLCEGGPTPSLRAARAVWDILLEQNHVQDHVQDHVM